MNPLRVRFRISRLMIVVAVVAINLALLRALFLTRRVDFLFGGEVIGIVLQVGVSRALRRRGRARATGSGS